MLLNLPRQRNRAAFSDAGRRRVQHHRVSGPAFARCTGRFGQDIATEMGSTLYDTYTCDGTNAVNKAEGYSWVEGR